MKIALVHKKHTTHGGTERYMLNLANFLADKKHDVHIFTSEWNDKLANDSISFHKVNFFGKKIGISKLIFAKDAYKKVEKNDFDIVQTFSRVGFGDVIRIGGGCHQVYVKNYLESIDNIFYKKYKELEYKLSINGFLTNFYEKKDFEYNYKKIIAISKTVKKQIMEQYNVPSEDIVINHNGVDIDKFNPKNKNIFGVEIRKKHNLSKDDLVLLFVGTGFKRKGLKYVLEAMKSVPKVKLLVVGKGNQQKFKNLAEKFNVKERVIFVGASSEVNKYYAAGDVFVLPTIYEPYGTVINEALASGLPVITTKAAGGAEILEDEKDGFLLNNHNNIDEIISSINKLSDKNLLEIMSENARNKATQYSEKNNFENVLNLYNSIVMEE